MKNNNNYSNFEVLGIDIGNRTCEAVSQFNYEKPVVFDSKVTIVKPLMTKCNELILDGVKYYVGEGKLDTDYRKVDKKHYLVLLYTLIALSSKSQNNKIVLGLPISQVQEDASELINLIMSNSHKEIKIDGTQRIINITDVEVLPEGVTTVSDDFNGIIIDVGAGTIDCCLMKTVRNERKILKPVSIPKGINTFYEEFINRLNENYTNLGLDFEADDAEEILDNGYFEYENEIYNITSEYYYDYFAEEVISKLRNSKYPLKNKPVSLTGGGSIALYNSFKKLIGNNVTIQDEPLFANARNFYELGVNIFSR